ncbi:hypothetical protein [Marinoscillum sp.]|uniref:hypothetical protein n=1 Tax=Marinoscillum sp. TaxID=2024838 RepID=UPI003BA92057
MWILLRGLGSFATLEVFTPALVGVISNERDAAGKPNHPHVNAFQLNGLPAEPIEWKGIVSLFDRAQSDNAFQASSCENVMLSSVEASDIFTSGFRGVVSNEQDAARSVCIAHPSTGVFSPQTSLSITPPQVINHKKDTYLL